MTDEDGLLSRLPGKRIIAKDLSVAEAMMPGNPYCRFDPDDSSRKYCSKDLYESAETKYVIPEGKKIPRKMVECGECGKESWRDNDDECGRCGCPMFDCPGCGEEVHGKPESCPHCDADYDWN